MPLPRSSFVLRIVGSIALAAALGLSGFVVYQLWITNLQAAHAQDGLTTAFAERVQAAEPATGIYQPEYLPLAPIVVPPEPEDPADLAGGGTVDEEPQPELILETAPELGQPIGEILIPKAGVDWVVVEGGRRQDLTLGAGHMPWTPLPGQPGNAVISGHRTTYGAPFRNIDDLEPGDIISVETTIGLHVYQVVLVRVINPEDTWVMGQWRGAWLTLTTCHPEFSASQRLVVIARLIDGPNAAAILGA